MPYLLQRRLELIAPAEIWKEANQIRGGVVFAYKTGCFEETASTGCVSADLHGNCLSTQPEWFGAPMPRCCAYADAAGICSSRQHKVIRKHAPESCERCYETYVIELPKTGN